MGDPTGKTSRPVQFRYEFHFSDGSKREFLIELDPVDLHLLTTPRSEVPDWTLLAFNKCSNCPLSDDVLHCPIAVNLVDLVEEFGALKSYEPVRVVVHASARDYSKQTTLQKGLSSMMGIYMSTSGCPILDRLRPNVRFHLPFASGLETFVRSISMHLLASFFAGRRGETMEPNLEALLELYREVTKVNKGMSSRLIAATQSDANVNALVILHTFGDGLQYYVDSSLNELEADYELYWRNVTTPDASADQPDDTI